MTGVDIAATRTAATAIRTVAQDLRGDAAGGGPARVTSAAGALSGSVTLDMLHDVESAVTVRLGDAAMEFDALAEGMTILADNVASATGEG